MNIQVHDEDSLYCPFSKQYMGRVCQVIEDAEAAAKVSKCVVSATSCVAGKTMLKCQLGGQ